MTKNECGETLITNLAQNLMDNRYSEDIITKKNAPKYLKEKMSASMAKECGANILFQKVRLKERMVLKSCIYRQIVLIMNQDFRKKQTLH